MSLDPRDMQFVEVNSESEITGAIFSSGTFIHCRAERTIWYADNGAAPSRTNLTLADITQSTATASVQDSASGNFHTTTITLTNLVVSVVSVTTGNGVGGTKIFDFPEGRISFLGGSFIGSISIAAAKQADFTDATPEGDIGIGTVAPANADAFGTDATDDDFCTGAAFLMAAYADSDVRCASEPSAFFDGTTTPKDAYVNVLVDAADIDDGVTTEVLINGTVTLNWVFLGDV